MSNIFLLVNIIHYASLGFLLIVLLFSFFLKRPTGKKKHSTIHGMTRIRGTIEDTIRQIEKSIQQHYSLPMEIKRNDNTVTFICFKKQSIYQNCKP